ncbi:MAG: sensor histidine kinase [Acidobacteria bacterium]|nr:sensor histidine kinase [Acidobacteriota bacterium]
MPTDPIFVPFAWRRGFGLARLGVTVCSLAGTWLSQAPLAWWVWALAAIYVVFGALVLIGRPNLHAARFLPDLTFFALLSAAGAGTSGWPAALAVVYAIVNAAVLMGWQEAALVFCCAALSLVLFPARPPALVAALLSGGVVAVLLALRCEFYQRRGTRLAAQSVHARAEAETARASERQRIAADFHDGPLQSFISYQMRLEVLRRLLERSPAAAREELEQMRELCRTQVAELRAFVRAMRQAEAPSAGLAASIRRLVEDFQKDSGTPATFAGGDVAGPEDPEVPLEVLQIVREALHNVQKHSKASRVAVAVSKTPSGLEISIDDDGCGFPFGGTFTLEELDRLRLGPLSIRRRVRELGGHLTLDSRPGLGSTLRVRIPL